MKKFFSFFLLTFAVLLFASEYNFVALGDIHYDGEKYHISPPSNSRRKHERERNFNMWNSGKSDAVLAAASKAATDNKAVFVAQIGDLTQGYCENVDLQVKMFTDGFPRIKGHFPNHKLYVIRGNHDARLEKGYTDEPSVKAFFPHIAKELGRERVDGTYIVRQSQDLFIFFDGFSTPKKSAAAVKQALEDNADARYVFFITHLPVLACSPAFPGWLIPGVAPITEMLAKVNAIILTAHTHLPSFISVETPHGTLTQMVVSSIGTSWDPAKPREVKCSDVDSFEKICRPQQLAKKTSVNAFKALRSYRTKEFTIYSPNSGFAVIKVNDDAVTADVYTSADGKPVKTEILRKNAKMENKK